MNAGDSQATIWQLVILLFVSIFVVALAGLAIGVAVPGVAGPVDGGSGDGTADHQNPNDLSGEQELSQLERQLASRVQQQVQSGALNLNREDYEKAREQLGDERYKQLREAYSGVNSGEGRQEQQRLLQEAQQGQLEYTELVGEYWDGLNEYEALDNTSNERQREKARELERITYNLTETAEYTIDHYSRLQNVSEEDYTSVISAINESKANITREQEQVRREQFISTNLTLATDFPAEISPAEALTVRARLTTEDGDPLSGEPVPLTIGEQTHWTTSNETGWFEVKYRPSLIQANSTSIPISYQPVNDSVYLRDEITRNVTVTQSTPTVSVDASPREVAYSSNVTVSGNVSMNGTSFADVPFLIRLEDEILARNETPTNGTLQRTVSVPAAVAPGERELTVQLLLENRALKPTNRTTTFQISESETELSIDAEPTDSGTLLVSGELTAAETAVPDQLLDISVNGTAVGVVRTETDGQFQTQVVVPDAVADEINGEGTVSVIVDFDGSETNLAPATATVSTRTSITAGGLSFTPWMLAPFGVLGALVGAYLLLRRDTAAEPTVPEPIATNSQTQTETTPAYLNQASEFLEDGRPAPAVQASYAAIREHLVADGNRGQTHWELYRENRDRFDESAQRALRVATEGYEQAAFAPSELDPTTAHEVLDAVNRLVDDEPRAN